MKTKLLFLITFLIVISIQSQNQEFTTYNQGMSFGSITVDDANKRVWAATAFGQGLYKIEMNQETEPVSFSQFNVGSVPEYDEVTINGLAMDLDGNLIVGHDGLVYTNYEGAAYAGHLGGINIINSRFERRWYSEANPMVPVLGGGLGSKRVSALTVDKNGKIWVAQKAAFWWDTVNIYIHQDFIYHGALSSKGRGDRTFRAPGTLYDSFIAGNAVPAELPLGLHYIPSGSNPPHREFHAVSTDSTEVWTSVGPYVATGGAEFPERILRYNLAGGFLGSFTFSETGIQPVGKINNICVNNELGTWVASSVPDKGFSVYKNGGWIHISPADFPNILEAGTRFNENAMWKDVNGKVFMGTNSGLIVYNGAGDVNVESSYKLYTNSSTSTSDLVIVDDTMVSNNIFGGCTDPNDSRINWITTADGIMKMGDREGIEIWHINDHTSYVDSSNSPEEETYNRFNSKFLSKLEDAEIPAEKMVMIAADGTKATFFRIYTNDPQGYYDGNYTLITGPGTGDSINDADYIKRYGKFTIKTPESHEDYDYSMTESYNISQFKYIEFVYQHPEYIDFLDYEDGKIYEFIDFKLIDNNSAEIFNRPLKIAVPPVLVLHGVWSNIYSVTPIRDYLKANGFPNYALSVKWRTIKNPDEYLPEHSFNEDAWVIPFAIKDLKEESSKNKFSVGKVNVVAHSRGGLYTRGYIEEINSEYEYKDDINSFITLDTPHFGAQGANNVLDKREIPYINVLDNIHFIADALTGYPQDIETYSDNITLGDIVSIMSEVPKRDRTVNGGDDWGAKNLVVENDNVSGITAADNIGFIPALNNSGNMAKLNAVRIHTIASKVNPCNTLPIFCIDRLDEMTDFVNIPDDITYGLLMKGIFRNILANVGVFDFVTGKLYGEPSDFVVPLSSQKGGLSGRFNTTNEESLGIDHSGGVGISVAKHPLVHSRVFNLIRSNVYDDVNGSFKKGLGTYTPLTYNYMEEELGRFAQRRPLPFVSKIVINKEPIVFDNREEGDVLNFKVYQEDVDTIMVFYKSENDSENTGLEVRTANITLENSFTYTIPVGYSGKLTITAYGFKNGIVGVAKSIVTLNVGIPDTVTLQSIHFTAEDPIILEQDNFNYSIEGTYSDGIDRRLNNEDITFIIDASSILSQVDANAVKGENIGVSLLTATINGFEDTIIVKVRENPSLRETILTGFYGIPNADNSAIDVNWETLREYESATFALETSYNTPDNFTEINQQAGNGTIQTPAQFNYADTSFGANTLIYYRIKMIDTQGNITYSSTIEINLSTAGVGENNLNNLVLEIYPNPVKTGEVTLKLNSKLVDANAKLELYSLQGKRLAQQTLKVLEGVNSFKLKIGESLTNGIYLVKVSTKGYVKTIKLIVK